MADPVQPGDASIGEQDIRVMVPRVRRAIEGAGRPAVLVDDNIRDIIADSLASLILYTQGVFGKTLIVTAYDNATGAPLEYATSTSLSLPEQVAVSSQAALDFFFFEWSSLKVMEHIADEAQVWEYQLSPTLMKAELDLLISARDKALQSISDRGPGLDSYTSFLEARDLQTSRLVETWRHFETGGYSLTTDYRFGVIG